MKLWKSEKFDKTLVQVRGVTDAAEESKCIMIYRWIFMKMVDQLQPT